jgi:hypothetical protein
MYLAGRFQWVRSLAVSYYRTKSRPSLVTRKDCSRLEDVDVSHVVACLEKDGFCNGFRLREETLSALRHFCEHSVCFGNGERKKDFLVTDRAGAEKAYGIRFSIGRYLDCLDRCPMIRDLVNDPILLSVARGYLGAEPTPIGARMWWSFATNSDLRQQIGDGQGFHYDLDDYRAIAFFFYLSDVDLESGPHVCVRGSHRRKPLRFLFSPFKSKSDQQISTFYGADHIVTICGPAGSAFAEDIFCFHKGLPPRTTDRLLLQIRYRFRAYGDGDE